MKKHLIRTFSLTFALVAVSSVAHAATSESIKPNVLLIISDDQGFGDFGFNDNKLVKTPNLDQFAAQSAVYRNFIVAAACSPTRSCLFTGRDHLLTGVWGVPPRANLRTDETRMPAFFKAAGYHTMHVGKLDTARVAKMHPHEFGWDDWMGGGGYEQHDPMIYERHHSSREKGWTADIWTDYALDYIGKHRDEPWFASVAFILPHLPWECAEKYSEPFSAQGCSKDLAACYGCIAHLDECIGRLLGRLQETGQAERTIVVFLSDNGPTSPEAKHDDEFGNVPGEDWQKRNVAHLRGHKALVWENGDRVPLLVRWPGHIAAGARQQLGGAEDVLPTLLELSGVSGDGVPHQPFTGISLKASLDDATSIAERAELFRMAISGKGAPSEVDDIAKRKFEKHHLTLRGRQFKYHALPGGRSALFDVFADPGETNDVQTKFPEIAAQMAKRCRERWDAIIASGRSFMPLPESEKVKVEQ